MFVRIDNCSIFIQGCNIVQGCRDFSSQSWGASWGPKMIRKPLGDKQFAIWCHMVDRIIFKSTHRSWDLPEPSSIWGAAGSVTNQTNHDHENADVQSAESTESTEIYWIYWSQGTGGLNDGIFGPVIDAFGGCLAGAPGEAQNHRLRSLHVMASGGWFSLKNSARFCKMCLSLNPSILKAFTVPLQARLVRTDNPTWNVSDRTGPKVGRPTFLTLWKSELQSVCLVLVEPTHQAY